MSCMGFAQGGEGRTAIMELKLSQELKSVDQSPLFIVFLDLRKAYDNLYHWRLLQTIEGYRAGTKQWGLLAELWSHQGVVTFQTGFHGPQFRTT